MTIVVIGALWVNRPNQKHPVLPCIYLIKWYKCLESVLILKGIDTFSGGVSPVKIVFCPFLRRGLLYKEILIE